MLKSGTIRKFIQNRRKIFCLNPNILSTIEEKAINFNHLTCFTLNFNLKLP